MRTTYNYNLDDHFGERMSLNSTLGKLRTYVILMGKSKIPEVSKVTEASIMGDPECDVYKLSLLAKGKCRNFSVSVEKYRSREESKFLF